MASRSKPAEWVKALPVGTFPFFEAGSPPALVPYFRDWLAHPVYDDYWRASSIEEHYDAISVPAYHVGGWRPVESRQDVLVWTTRPFDRDIEVTGPVSIDLFVSSTARDTDFTAKLVDVWPNGFAQNLTDGIVRMRFRESREHPSLLEPGKVYEVTIDLAATSDVLFVGHSLRVDVSSSDFPRFDRNLSSQESPELGTRGTTARNTIYHDAAHPSALVVSVVPPEKPR